MNSVSYGPTVLIVDEHAGVRRALAEFMSALRPQLRLLVACGAEAAQALVAAERPCMVLMGFNQTGGSEYAAIHRIREEVPGCCVVAVSMHDDEAHRAAAAAAGSAWFIAKRNLAGDLPRLLECVIGEATRAADEPWGDLP